MSYTPINWDEYTPITATNLDIMDMGINDNEGRITTNENDINDNENRITTNENDIGDNEGRISTNENDISSNEGRISNNEDDISSNEGRISTNEDDISSLETEQSNQDDRITTNESKLDTIQGSETSVDGRITNLESYVVGDNSIFQSLSQENTTSTSFTTLKEFLFGRKGDIRLTFEIKNSSDVYYDYVYYEILVDGSTVASGDHSGTDDWISYTEDISIDVGSNVKFQLKTSDDSNTVSLRNVRVKVGNSSDNIIEV